MAHVGQGCGRQIAMAMAMAMVKRSVVGERRCPWVLVREVCDSASVSLAATDLPHVGS
jgi:hypothetical protein